MKEYLEYVGEDSTRRTKDSKKFWEVEVKGKTVLIRYGRIGADGVTTLKKFGSSLEAQEFATKAVAEKVKKGYAQADEAPVAVGVEFFISLGAEDFEDSEKLTKKEKKQSEIGEFIYIFVDSDSSRKTVTMVLGADERVELPISSIENRVDGDYEEDRDFRVLLHFVEVNCSIPASSKDMFLKCHKRWEKSFSDSDLKFELALGDKKFDANSFWLID
jgi:predicted DNA-binding WGR domain protein